jgi:hypothetical protein
MTPPCPRCRAPLTGPVCSACGAGAWPPPHPAYPPYPPHPHAGPWGPYPGHPYGGVAVARGKGLAVPGGIMSIIAGAIVMLLALATLGADGAADDEAAVVVLGICAAFGAGGIVFGVFSIKGRWWGAMIAGIAQTLICLTSFLFIGAIEEARQERELFGSYMSQDEREAFDVLVGAFGLLSLFALVTAILCYIGISSARRHAAYLAHQRATLPF